MTILFFKKCLKFDEDFIKETQNWKKVFRFQDNCVWIEKSEFSQSRTGYLSSAVNVLTKTLKISNFTNGDVFEIISYESDEKTW